MVGGWGKIIQTKEVKAKIRELRLILEAVVNKWTFTGREIQNGIIILSEDLLGSTYLIEINISLTLVSLDDMAVKQRELYLFLIFKNTSCFPYECEVPPFILKLLLPKQIPLDRLYWIFQSKQQRKLLYYQIQTEPKKYEITIKTGIKISFINWTHKKP